MIRQPPSSTLLPYRPLFRSPDQRRVAACGRQQPVRELAVGQLAPAGEVVGLAGPPLLQDGVDAAAVVVDVHPVADRKSTRLNSSHANISYAVFCLKKQISSS